MYRKERGVGEWRWTHADKDLLAQKVFVYYNFPLYI